MKKNMPPPIATHTRSVVKAITFRIIATLATIALVMLYTDDLKIAGAVGTLDFLTKLVIYYLHERAWGRVIWGRKNI
jgi:uncharacterized membrane protein